jgi:hypothetical protein
VRSAGFNNFSPSTLYHFKPAQPDHLIFHPPKEICTMNMQTITLPAFGTAIPNQGGHFAAIMRGPLVDGVEQAPYALLVAPTATEGKAIWGEYGKDVLGTASRTHGKANTDAMLLAHCPAAIAVRDLTVDGHSDYYLPSISELNAAAANVPELFGTDGYYWTSTQGSRYGAFVQVFEYGGSYWDGKDFEHRVRAFRAIPLEALTT